MRVTISSFGGIVPRTSPHALASYQASIAHDVKLRNGRLEAWKERCDFKKVALDSHTVHIHGCCALAWAELVQAAEGAPDWGRFFITGRRPYAEMVSLDCECNPVYERLGVPAPLTPPRADGVEACARDADARAYVYTYVNRWGEESAPSPASNIITVSDGEAVRVTNIALPPDGYGITQVNLYRATTGYRESNVKKQEPRTDFQYVVTLNVPTTSYLDRTLLTGLGAVLETQKVRTPPAELENIVALDGVVRLAGSHKNRIYVSENFQVYNWPVKYELTLDSTIVHMGALEQKLYVTTDTTPYVIDLSSCEDFKCVPVDNLGVPLPDIACKYASSAVMTQHGFIYSTALGLVLIDPAARYHIITKAWFSEDDWAQVKPDTVRLAYWEGFLFCITDEVSFMLNIDIDPYGDMKGSELVTISDKPVDIKRSSTGALFMLEKGQVSVWDMGSSFRPFTWVSRELPTKTGGGTGSVPTMNPALGAMWSPAVAKVRTRDSEFTLLTPLQDISYTRKVVGEAPFRLPRMGRHMWYKVKLHGIEPVEFVDIGTAHLTVNEGV